MECCESCENAVENLPESVSLEGLTPQQYLNVVAGLCTDCLRCEDQEAPSC